MSIHFHSLPGLPVGDITTASGVFPQLRMWETSHSPKDGTDLVLGVQVPSLLTCLSDLAEVVLQRSSPTQSQTIMRHCEQRRWRIYDNAK
eukprot:6461798-Amphidinium_carterae.1